MAAPPTITIIGSLNIDLVTYTARIPEAGETLSASSFQSGSGGKGGNQAAACARLSRSQTKKEDGDAIIKMLAAVGDDIYGQTLRKDLQASGVDTSGVRTVDDIETGVATILVEESTGENRILIAAGANETLKPSQFKALPDPNPSMIILQLEIPLDTTLQILSTARKAGVPVLLNPAPAIPLPDEAYKELAHLIVNETEAAMLSGCKAEDLDSAEQRSSVARIFHDKGVRNVIITLGGNGVFYSATDSEAGTGVETGHVPARKVKVVDTTAAGDTFVGAYALGVVCAGLDVGAAVARANAAAAVTVGRKGAQGSIPWRDELVDSGAW